MASVKQAWIRKYGEEEGLRRWEKQKKKYGRTKEQLREKYGDDYVKELSRKKATYSLEACIKRYGKIDGPKKWQERLSKKIETQRKRKEAGHRYKNGRTLEEYQEKYGIEEGFKRWDARNKRQSYMVSTQRYIDEYGEEKGREIIRDIKDNSSLKSFIERYGKELGTKRYHENCKKCAITEDKMIKKYGPELGKIKYKQWLFRITQSTGELFARGYSKISQKLFNELYSELDEPYKDNAYYAELNQEYQFYVNHEQNYPKKIIRVDFKCGNAIIEFDGSYWHDEELDNKRDSLLESKGYEVLRVSDKEYNDNPNLIINKCKQFIYENAQIKPS